MRFYRPHSFYGLLLTGFFFVSLPLIAALVSSVRILDGLVQQSAVAVYSSVDRVSSSRKIAGLLQDQERKARLYNVLGEASQLAEVNRMHEEITRVLDHLAASVSDEELLQLIARLRAGESYLVAALNRTSSGPESLKKEQEEILSRYRDIDRLAAAVERASNKLMIDQVDALKEKVSHDKETLIWQTSGLIGFSALLIAVFMVLISKPVRQIDKGIERLGDGDFKTPVEVFGPRDLEALGRKLDWLRQRLAKLDREKVKMVAHISHELKTPLASIKEGVGLLRDELVGPMNRSQEDVVAILDKNCGKLQKLIENILDFNMAQARKGTVEKKEVRLDELIDSVISDHRNSILARHIRLDVRLANTRIDANPQQLRTVFDNLLSNAVKFTPEEGTIRIRMKNEGGLVHVLVEDSGPGIDDEDRSRIFSPFFQGKGAKNAIVKGSGLGLAITKEYVQNHGGEIRLLTRKKGACFAVTLPLST